VPDLGRHSAIQRSGNAVFQDSMVFSPLPMHSFPAQCVFEREGGSSVLSV
jgi:hypothetical protein